jgi:hypothetical protein
MNKISFLLFFVASSFFVSPAIALQENVTRPKLTNVEERSKALLAAVDLPDPIKATVQQSGKIDALFLLEPVGNSVVGLLDDAENPSRWLINEIQQVPLNEPTDRDTFGRGLAEVADLLWKTIQVFAVKPTYEPSNEPFVEHLTLLLGNEAPLFNDYMASLEKALSVLFVYASEGKLNNSTNLLNEIYQTINNIMETFGSNE